MEKDELLYKAIVIIQSPCILYTLFCHFDEGFRK